MLSTDECLTILDENTLRYKNVLTLHCKKNAIEFDAVPGLIKLSESQKRLFICLIKRINCKRKIMNVVWYENHQRLSDNNYHQLVFQTRALLKENDLPTSLLMTIHYIGIKLNDKLLTELVPPKKIEPEFDHTQDKSWLSRFIIRVISL